MKDTITPELLESTEKYYSGLMAQDEKQEFEERLEKDPEFKQQVLDIKWIILAVETQSLKEKLNEFHQAIPESLESKSSSMRSHFLNFRNIAAAIVILALSATFYFYSGSPNEKLYESYFLADPGLPTTMSTSTNYDFYDAMVNYKRGDYKTAISKWKKLEVNKSDNDTLTYFLGVAYLADKEVDLAIPYLINASKNKGSVFYEDANYYLGLAYLKKENTAEAIRFLERSSVDKSRKLLEELK